MDPMPRSSTRATQNGCGHSGRAAGAQRGRRRRGVGLFNTIIRTFIAKRYPGKLNVYPTTPLFNLGKVWGLRGPRAPARGDGGRRTPLPPRSCGPGRNRAGARLLIGSISLRLRHRVLPVLQEVGIEPILYLI